VIVLCCAKQLRQQLSLILETRETARGLIVNVSDVLFDFNQATLKPGAREKLAKVAGILGSHKGLKIEIEGHADSIGSDDYNQRLSERRAQSVGAYLSEQGAREAIVGTVGFGESRPVATNGTAAGRQQNRRVENRRVGRTDREVIHRHEPRRHGVFVLYSGPPCSSPSTGRTSTEPPHSRDITGVISSTAPVVQNFSHPGSFESDKDASRL
jgi:hypothetical protein